MRQAARLARNLCSASSPGCQRGHSDGRSRCGALCFHCGAEKEGYCEGALTPLTPVYVLIKCCCRRSPSPRRPSGSSIIRHVSSAQRGRRRVRCRSSLPARFQSAAAGARSARQLSRPARSISQLSVSPLLTD